MFISELVNLYLRNAFDLKQTLYANLICVCHIKTLVSGPVRLEITNECLIEFSSLTKYDLWSRFKIHTHDNMGKFHNIYFFIQISRACQVCTPNATNVVWSHCQCVLADGVERGILTANRMIPGPSIQVCEGDRVVVDVENHMEGMEVTIHWHGIWQRGSQYYDGVPFVTQCPIQQGNTFR